MIWHAHGVRQQPTNLCPLCYPGNRPSLGQLLTCEKIKSKDWMMDTFFPGISVNILLLQTSAHLSLLGSLRAQTGLDTALLAAHCFVANAWPSPVVFVARHSHWSTLRCHSHWSTLRWFSFVQIFIQSLVHAVLAAVFSVLSSVLFFLSSPLLHASFRSHYSMATFFWFFAVICPYFVGYLSMSYVHIL